MVVGHTQQIGLGLCFSNYFISFGLFFPFSILWLLLFELGEILAWGRAYGVVSSLCQN